MRGTWDGGDGGVPRCGSKSIAAGAQAREKETGKVFQRHSRKETAIEMWESEATSCILIQ